MRRTRWATGVVAGLLATLAIPASALAAGSDLQDAVDGVFPASVAINSVWVLVATVSTEGRTTAGESSTRGQ